MQLRILLLALEIHVWSAQREQAKTTPTQIQENNLYGRHAAYICAWYDSCCFPARISDFEAQVSSQLQVGNGLATDVPFCCCGVQVKMTTPC